MLKHKLMEHPDEDIVFRMKVLKKHKSAFERQVTEAVLIEMEDDGLLLNSKGGFNRCALPRIQVVVGEKLVEEREKTLTKFDEILTSRQTEVKRKGPPGLTGDSSPPHKKNKKLTGDFSPSHKKTKRDFNFKQRVDGEKERLDTERKEKDPGDGKKEAKAKARKVKVPLNEKIPPHFNFIPISRVFSVKPKTVYGESDNWGSRQRYLRKPGEGGALS